MSRKKLELDGETRRMLSSNGTNWDSMGVFGLRGKEVSNAHYQQVGSGSPENPKSKVDHVQARQYSTPRILNGQVVCSRTLKRRMVSTGVVFAGEAFEESVSASRPEESKVTLSQEYWDGKKVNMNGTRVARFDSRKGGNVRPHKGHKKTKLKTH